MTTPTTAVRAPLMGASAAPLHDEALPAAAVLLGEDAEGMVRAAYAMAQLDVVDLAVRQVLYEPGEALSVRYAATLAAAPASGASTVSAPAAAHQPVGNQPAGNQPAGNQPAGNRAERRRQQRAKSPEPQVVELRIETVVAAIDVDGPPPGSLVLEADGMQVGLFRWPHDPALPGLERASDTSFHPQWWAPCGEDLELEVLTYRPGRRAVIRGAGAEGTVFVKVLTPRRAARVTRRLAALREVGLPVPRVLDHTDDGVVVLETLPGRTMRDLMTEGRTDELPHPRALVELLTRLPQQWVGTTRTVDPPSFHAERHARLLATVVPELADRLDALVAQLAEVPNGDPVAVHGDFHDDQVLVEDGVIVGLLDVDGSGTGSRVDDLGTFIGHLVNRGLDVPLPQYATYVASVVDAFAEDAERFGTDAGALAAQVAATVVGLATGPYRVQEDDWRRRTVERVALAEQWAAEARRLSTRSTDATSTDPFTRQVSKM